MRMAAIKQGIYNNNNNAGKGTIKAAKGARDEAKI